MKKRLPLLIFVGVGLLLWKTGGFGFFPSERTVLWRFPVSYGEVRRLELQIWDGEALIKREEHAYAAGLVGEPSVKVPLASGPHRAIATVTLSGEAAPRGFQADFDPGSEETVVVDMAAAVKKP